MTKYYDENDDIKAEIAAQFDKLQLAIKIKRAVMLLDKEPPKDTDINFDPFKSTSSSDVLNFIDRYMEQIDKDVIFFLARNSLAELEKQRDNLEKELSKQNSDNAKQKGSGWLQAANEQWNERGNEFKSLRGFAWDIAETPLKDDAGNTYKAPEFDQVYRKLLEKRKAGYLKDWKK